MKLLTEEIKRRLPPLYATEKVPCEEKVVQFKLFHPASGMTWYIVEGSLQEDGDMLFFGFVHNHGDDDEW